MMLIAAVVAIAFVWWMFRRQAPAAARPLPVPLDKAPAALQRHAAAPWAASPAGSAPFTPVASAPLPAELASFVWKREAELEPARRDTLLAAVRGIPRPPRSMQQLLSPEFLASASSADLSELVMGEPLIAAKVLSTVNSPLYGLQKTVTSIGQAITFLGMNTVRSICLRYMLDESFKAGDPASQRVFERLWTASAVASELCSRLTKQLHMPDAGTLVTKVVLSFVGHMAVATLPQSRSQLGSRGLQWAQRLCKDRHVKVHGPPHVCRICVRSV